MSDKQSVAGIARASVRILTVDAESAGQRLDNFLARELKGVPRGHLYRLLRTGQVRVNGGRRRPDTRLETGDAVRLPPIRIPTPRESQGPLRRTRVLLDEGVLYEDPILLVVNKPAGMPVHGGSGFDGGLIEALRTLRGEPGLELVHRLDRDTSGCLIVARRRSALRALHAAFRQGDVEKRYLALLAGRVKVPFRSDAPLKRYVRRGGERQVAVSPQGRTARTTFHPLAVGEKVTLVQAQPDTGRTHQIRVHAAHAGHPVAGDPRYGNKALNHELRAAGLRRLALHAEAVSFVHPQSGQRMHLTAPLPTDIARVVEALTGYHAD